MHSITGLYDSIDLFDHHPSPGIFHPNTRGTFFEMLIRGRSAQARGGGAVTSAPSVRQCQSEGAWDQTARHARAQRDSRCAMRPGAVPALSWVRCASGASWPWPRAASFHPLLSRLPLLPLALNPHGSRRAMASSGLGTAVHVMQADPSLLLATLRQLRPPPVVACASGTAPPTSGLSQLTADLIAWLHGMTSQAEASLVTVSVSDLSASLLLLEALLDLHVHGDPFVGSTTAASATTTTPHIPLELLLPVCERCLLAVHRRTDHRTWSVSLCLGVLSLHCQWTAVSHRPLSRAVPRAFPAGRPADAGYPSASTGLLRQCWNRIHHHRGAWSTSETVRVLELAAQCFSGHTPLPLNVLQLGTRLLPLAQHPAPTQDQNQGQGQGRGQKSVVAHWPVFSSDQLPRVARALAAPAWVHLPDRPLRLALVWRAWAAAHWGLPPKNMSSQAQHAGHAAAWSQLVAAMRVLELTARTCPDSMHQALRVSLARCLI